MLFQNLNVKSIFIKPHKTPAVAVLLFVTTSLAKTTYDQTIRYCYPFVLTLILVMLIIVFFPGLASWIPNHFLGP